MKKFGNEKPWIVRYHPLVLSKDVKILDTSNARRIKQAIELKLFSNPLLYGTPLHGVLARFFKLRVRDWRVVYEISPPFVDVLFIGHRKDVYERVQRRYNL